MLPPNFGLQSAFNLNSLLAGSSQMSVTWHENPQSDSAITQLSTSLTPQTGTRCVISSSYLYLYRLSSGRVALCARPVGGALAAAVSLAGYQSIGEGHFYVVTLDIHTGEARFYRDGACISQASWGGLLGATFYVGSLDSFSVNCHNGGVNNSYLGEVRVYRRVLSADDVHGLYTLRGADRLFSGLAARVCCTWRDAVRVATPYEYTGATYFALQVPSEMFYRYTISPYTDMIHVPDTLRTRPRRRRK